MIQKFEMGEVAIGCDLCWEGYNGEECVIIGSLCYRTVVNAVTFARETWLAYRVQWVDGLVTVQLPEQLRKKQPPGISEEIMRMAILKASQPESVEA